MSTEYVLVVTLATGLFLAHHTLRYRRAYKSLRVAMRTQMPAMPIFTSPLEIISCTALGRAFLETDTGPTRAAEVSMIGCGAGEYASVSDTEAWILSVLAKEAMNMFEFGTATGRTAYLLARNSPEQARLTTLTLPPDGHGVYAAATGDNESARATALKESRFTRFVYSGSEVEGKIEQLFGDSKLFDPSHFAEQCDLIFVDGSHAYSYVKHDTENALQMLKPGGIILWHDYRGPNTDVGDVYRYLNELGEQLPLKWISGTSLVCYRKPPNVGTTRHS